MSHWQPSPPFDLPLAATPASTPAGPADGALKESAQAGAAPADGEPAERDPAGDGQAPMAPGRLPTMDQLNRFSAGLDEIDAALARMDHDAGPPAPLPT